MDKAICALTTSIALDFRTPSKYPVVARRKLGVSHQTMLAHVRQVSFQQLRSQGSVRGHIRLTARRTHLAYGANNQLDYRHGVTFCEGGESTAGAYICGINKTADCRGGHALPLIEFGNPAAVPSQAQTTMVSSVAASSIVALAQSSFYNNLHITTIPVPSSLLPVSSTSSSTNSTTSSTAAMVSTSAIATQELDTGLSTAAQAGIGIGVAVGALALLAVGAVLFLRRRRRKGTAEFLAPRREPLPEEPQEMSSGVYPTAELPAPYSTQKVRHEMYASPSTHSELDVT